VLCPNCGKNIKDGSYQCVFCAAVMPGAAKSNDNLVGIVPVNTSGWAIAAGYLGLFSLVFIGAPFAIFTGIMALRHISKNPGMRGRVRAWVGIVLGSLGLLGLAGVIISAAMS
jgi:hypothetical protein